MKTINSLLTGLLLTASVFLTQQATAQAPQRMSYQSVLRNSSNVLLAETLVGIKISVLQGGASGTAVYVETQTATTNANGLLSIQIGAGTATTGSFATINWAAGTYFIKTETDPAGGTNYSITGTQEILSVPYAMYAAKSGDATTMGAISGSSSTNGATINAGVLSLTPADAANGGIVTNGTQTIGGAKTFTQSVTANSFAKTGGTSSQYLMADGSTSVGLINEGSFEIRFSNIGSPDVIINYKEITEGSSKIVHLYIPKFKKEWVEMVEGKTLKTVKTSKLFLLYLIFPVFKLFLFYFLYTLPRYYYFISQVSLKNPVCFNLSVLINCHTF